MNNTDKAIADHIGPNKAMISEFRTVLVRIHRERESAAVENNIALRDVFNSFGSHGPDFGAIVRGLREGGDGSRVKKLDEMAEYACRHYRHLMGNAGGESGSSTDEQAFAEWVVRGYIPVPKVTDQTMLEATTSYLGAGFFEAFPATESVEGEKRTGQQQDRMNAKEALDNNTTMSALFKRFGHPGAKFSAILRALRSGSKGHGVANFTEMATFACHNHSHLIAPCRTDGDDDVQAFTKWAIRGYVYANSKPPCAESGAAATPF